MNNEKIECRKCIHYFITWDQRFPYGCKLYEVKSRQMPSIIVYQSLGSKCPNFVKKENSARA